LGSSEASYYDWVDQFDTFGLGRNVPIATGNENGGLLALQNGKWVVLTVPYPAHRRSENRMEREGPCFIPRRVPTPGTRALARVCLGFAKGLLVDWAGAGGRVIHLTIRRRDFSCE